jgi:aminoglycoside phosphotransferase (APT) family kinase protein
VPAELDATITDATLVSAARLIRRYHDATAGSKLAAQEEIACHNDLSPCNFVFHAGRPVAIIDFDRAAPGRRLQDLGYAIFLWLNLGTDGPAAGEQAKRITLFCDAYEIDHDEQVIDAILAAVATNTERLRRERRLADVEWWQAQLDWIAHHRDELAVGARAGSL